ncbi:MAG: aminotransferase class V-fold PLP-dependent enzyme [Candidatus Dormibacteraceae bacterium]
MLDLTRIRAETPGVGHRIHLNNAGAGLLSDRTLRAVTGHLQLEAEIGGYEAHDLRHDVIERTYLSLARLLGARREEIALFDNSTHAWNAAFYSIPFHPGDRILTGHAEYGSNVLAYLQTARRRGVEIVVIPNDESGQIDVQALAERIDRRTRMIGLSHIPTSGGLVNPAAEVGRVAREAGVLYLLDATQTVGQLPLGVDEVGADLVTATGRKFLRGPRGTGFLYVRSSILDRLDPFVNEIEASTWDGASGFTWHAGARRFETWEHSYSTVLGLGSAVDQALELGMKEIGERAIALGARLRDGLDAISGVHTHDLGSDRCAIVTASLDGVPAATFVEAIRSRGINVSQTNPEDNQFDERGVHPLVRLSPHYYNSEEEIDTALGAIAEIAGGSTPGA